MARRARGRRRHPAPPRGGTVDVAEASLQEAKLLLDRGIEAPAMVVRYHRCAGEVARASGRLDQAGHEAERARLLALSIAHPRVGG